MRVAVLTLDNVFDLGLAAVLDAFQTANELIELNKLTVAPFDARMVGVRTRVKTSQGLQVPIRPLGHWAPDCVVVPAIGYKMPVPLEKALACSEVRDAGAALREWNRYRRVDDGGMHRHIRDGGIRFARRATGDDDVVAGSVVSSTLSEGGPRRIEHDRQVRPLCDRRRRAESHGSRTVADSKR